MKTSEMISILEKNPKLKYVSNRNQAEVTARVGILNVLIFEGATSGDRVCLDRDDWELVREPVPVWEAVKAFTEGKRVSCHRSHGLQGCHCVFNDLSDGIKICPIGFTKGTWYIEQGE